MNLERLVDEFETNQIVDQAVGIGRVNAVLNLWRNRRESMFESVFVAEPA